MSHVSAIHLLVGLAILTEAEDKVIVGAGAKGKRTLDGAAPTDAFQFALAGALDYREVAFDRNETSWPRNTKHALRPVGYNVGNRRKGTVKAVQLPPKASNVRLERLVFCHIISSYRLQRHARSLKRSRKRVLGVSRQNDEAAESLLDYVLDHVVAVHIQNTCECSVRRYLRSVHCSVRLANRQQASR